MEKDITKSTSTRTLAPGTEMGKYEGGGLSKTVINLVWDMLETSEAKVFSGQIEACV